MPFGEGGRNQTKFQSSLDALKCNNVPKSMCRWIGEPTVPRPTLGGTVAMRGLEEQAKIVADTSPPKFAGFPAVGQESAASPTV